jgi:putative oxidoreductase
MNDLGRLLLRLAVGGLMLFHGIDKIVHGVGMLQGTLREAGLPGFFAYGAYVSEVAAPVLILGGFLTRPAALIVAADVAATILFVLRNQILTVKVIGGGWSIELEAFYLLGALALFLLGGGRYAIAGGRRD